MISERILSKTVSTLGGRYLKLDPRDDVELSSPQAGKHYLLYMHVPFCESLCPYCSFNRFPFARERAIRICPGGRFLLDHTYRHGTRRQRSRPARERRCYVRMRLRVDRCAEQ